MRSAILAFVLGVWALQQMPQLPDLVWVSGLLFFLLPLWAWRAAPQFPARLGHRCFLLLFTLGAGFFWAATLAHERLADALPPAWEGQDIQLVGVVATLPQLQERGERFAFDVEQVETPQAQVPQRITLTRYAGGFMAPVHVHSAPLFHAGERWRITVRLKRPHGSYNPYGFDAEAWLLERNLRATGYLRPSPGNTRLQALVWRPGYLVEHVRETLRDRFQQVLGEARYGGVLMALAIGDESAIRAADWQVFLRTGVKHLMSRY